MLVHRLGHRLRQLALVWTLSFWVICIAIPLGVVLYSAIFPSVTILSESPGAIWGGFGDALMLHTVRSTLWQASMSTVFSGVLALPLGLWIGQRLGLGARPWVESLLMVSSGVPSLVSAMAWLLWLGRSGQLAQWGIELPWAYSLKAVVLAHVFFNVPWIAYSVAQARRDIPRAELEAVDHMSGGFWDQFRWVIWPQVRWVYFGSLSQVMAFCSMSFVLVLILGGGPTVQTLETELFQNLRYGLMDLNHALAFAVWELILTLVPWGLVCFFRRCSTVHNTAEIQCGLTRITSVGARTWVAWSQDFLLILGALFWILPYGIVVSGKFWKNLAQMHGDAFFRGQIWASLQTSLVLAACGSLGCVVTAGAAVLSLQTRSKFRGLLQFLLGIPSGVSILVLSLGFWMAYGRWMDPFAANWIPVILLQMTLFFPSAFRMLWAVALRRPTAQLDNAALLGAHSIQIFQYVEWPRWKGPLVAVAAGVAGASLGEIGAVSLLMNDSAVVPLPLLISRWMQQYRFEEAQTTSGLLFLISLCWIVGSMQAGRRFSN